MRGAWARVALLWLAASQVVFLLELRQPPGGGTASTLPFGPAMRAAELIPAAFGIHGAGGGGLAWPWAVMAAAACLAFAGAGRAGLAGFRWLGWRHGGASAFMLAPPAGLLPVAAAVQGLGLCGLVRPPVAYAGLAVLFLSGLRALPGTVGALSGMVPQGFRAGALALGGLVVLLAGIPAMAPERNVDALIYHLPIPFSWLEAGRIVARPDWAFAGLAQGHELLSYAGFAAGFDERWARVTSLLAACWLGVLVMARLRGRWGVAAAALLLTAPLLSEVSGTAKNDAVFALEAFAALLALERAAAGGSAAAVAAAGWLCGAAYATKNFGVFAFVALAAALSAAPGLRRRPSAWAALVLPVTAAAVPYAARNWLTLGSPAYPFLLSLMPPVGWTEGKLAMMGVVFNARAFSVGSAGELLASPLHALAGASPFILAFLPVAAATRGIRAGHAPMLAFLCVWFAAWAVGPTGGVTRFLAPLLAPALVVSARAAEAAAGSARIPARLLLAGALAVHAIATLAGPAWSPAPLGVALGREGLAGFRGRTAPVWTEAVGWLGGEAGTAMVVGQGVQYSRPRGARLLAREIENAPPVWELVRASHGEAGLAKRFRQRKVRFVLYNLTAANFWVKYAEAFPWTPRDVEVYRRFWLAHAGPVRVSSSWSPEEGLIIMYRIDAAGRPGRPGGVAASGGTPRTGLPTQLFLPGTEAVFSPIRRAYFDGRGGADLEALVSPWREPLAGVLALEGREAMIALGRGDTARAARITSGMWPGLHPLERAACRLCGVPECPDPARLRGWLASAWPQGSIRGSDRAALLLNMGLPPALPPR